MNTWVNAFRFLGWFALLVILALAIVMHRFDGRPEWCPPNVPTSQCAQVADSH